MAKLNLNKVQSGFFSTALLNQNFADIEKAIENTLSLDGTNPNSMNAHLDMNSNDILNANYVFSKDLFIKGVSVDKVFSSTIDAKNKAEAAASSALNSKELAASYAAQANEAEADAERLVQAAVSGFQGFTDGVGYDFGVIYDSVTYFNRDWGSIV